MLGWIFRHGTFPLFQGSPERLGHTKFDCLTTPPLEGFANPGHGVGVRVGARHQQGAHGFP